MMEASINENPFGGQALDERAVPHEGRDLPQRKG
jgi:hypothetical protein